MMFMNLVAICLALIWAKVFAKGKSAGIIPKDVTLGGSWSTVTEYGDANYLNVVSIPAVDCTDVF